MNGSTDPGSVETGKKRCSLLSVITPAFNEARNLPVLNQRLVETLESLGINWEWIVVDDHSVDETFSVVEELAHRDGRVRGIRLSRNFGSHRALTCGMDNARGDCVVVMAADLQDPPETLPALLKQWDAGAQVVWAVRSRREGEKLSTLAFGRLYHWFMRHVVGIRELPATGADFFLLDRRVLDALRQFKEINVSIMALVTWMGFRQSRIAYDKKASFTYLPIRLMSYVGFVIAFVGFVYAGLVIANALTGQPTQGWSSLMVVVLIIGGVQMLMMGVLGEYLWRALDESRQRPRYLIEATTRPQPDIVAGSACSVNVDT
jgi:dolichol-phosphate mannosyltransferase